MRCKCTAFESGIVPAELDEFQLVGPVFVLQVAPDRCVDLPVRSLDDRVLAWSMRERGLMIDCEAIGEVRHQMVAKRSVVVRHYGFGQTENADPIIDEFTEDLIELDGFEGDEH